MSNSGDSHYRIETKESEFWLIDESGNKILVCRDRGSAEHYLVLVNEAFKRGYKLGFRDGRTGVVD